MAQVRFSKGIKGSWIPNSSDESYESITFLKKKFIQHFPCAESHLEINEEDDDAKVD